MRSSVRRRRPGATARTLRERIDFDQLSANNVDTLFLFSKAEPAYDQLARQGHLASLQRWPNIRVEQLPTADHDIRALAVQDLVNAQIDRAIEAVRITMLEPA